MDDDIRRAFILWLKMDADSRALLRRLLSTASPEQLRRYAQATGMTEAEISRLLHDQN
ncbi:MULTISPECIES: hypothetical protein [unclassified Clostridium]|uniref:hypothetical protein n=1 Tax=unclassified Clostridium TaxID=2614128 RepID=UPI0014856482|nr:MULTISPECIES: hypothetical protein [unclassified Clostridium]